MSACVHYILSSLTLLQYRMSAVHNTYCRHLHCFSTGCQLCTIHTVVTYIALVQDVSCAHYILSSLTLLQNRMSARHLHCFSTGCQLCTIHTVVTYIALVQDVSCAHYILSSLTLLQYRMSAMHNTYCRHLHSFSTGCQLCTLHTVVTYIALVQDVSCAQYILVVTYIALVQDVSCAQYILSSLIIALVQDVSCIIHMSSLTLLQYRMSAVHNTYCRHFHCFTTGCQLYTIHILVIFIALVQDVSCAQYILSSFSLLQYRVSAYAAYCRHLHCFSTGCQLCTLHTVVTQLCTIHTVVTYIALVQDVSCAQYILSSFSLLQYRMSAVHNTYCRHLHCFSTGCQLCTLHTVVTYIALVQDVSYAQYILSSLTLLQYRMSAVHNTYCRHLHCFSTGCQLQYRMCRHLHCCSTGCQLCTYCRHLHCFSTGCQLCTIHTVVTYIALVQDVSCAQYILSSFSLLQYRMSAVHNIYCRHFHCFTTGCQLYTIHIVVIFIALVQDVSCAQYILSSFSLLQYRVSVMHNTYCRHLHCFSTGCQLCNIHTVVIFIALLQDVSCTQYILSSFSLLQYRMSAVHNTYSRHFHCFSTGCQLCIIHTVTADILY